MVGNISNLDKRSKNGNRVALTYSSDNIKKTFVS
jgi:hypothetical protein